MAPRLTRTPKRSLESQLAGVLEQDGVTMISPEGIRRRAKRPRAPRESIFSHHAEISFDPSSEPLADHIAELDHASLGVFVTSDGPARERVVPIHQEERPRSPFVLSLRQIPVAMQQEETEERIPVEYAFEQLSHESSFVAEPAVYGTLTQDLWVPALDAAAIREQFTHQTFVRAYTSVYGYADRMRSALRNALDDVSGLFIKLERVEHRVEDGVEEAFHVMDVPRLSYARAIAGFVGLLLIVTLPANAVSVYRSAMETRDAAQGAGEAGVNELLSAAQGGSLPETAESLQRASGKFREAESALDESRLLAVGIASVLPREYRAARALIDVGDKSSQAGRLLALAFEKMFRDPGRRLDERLDVLGAYARAALPLLTDASKAAATVRPETLPEEKREAFQKLASGLEASTESVREFAGMADLLSALVGKERPRTYLLVFQNQTELRPTGGFMGSVAEVVLDRGQISKVRVPPGGTYDLKGQLLAHVISPAPLHLINAHWQFQDANWFPDFPTSAEKIRWFWSKSGQPTLDGVIAVNASFVEKIFDVTGPIDMPEYGKVIDRSNFLLETQKAVELEYDREANTPKKFVGDLMDALRERMKTLSSDDWLKVAALLSESVETKDVQIALFQPEEQQVISRYGWSGELKETEGDRLALVEANIAGQKTDGVIREQATLNVDIRPDGSIVDTVKLVRTHTGTKGELFRGVRNVSYLRAYVPKGAELLSASGFDSPASSLFKQPDDDYAPDPDVAAIEATTHDAPGSVAVGEEGSRTVLGGWMQLDPGETQTLTLTYKLPFRVSDLRASLDASPEQASQSTRASYLLLATSQSGKGNRDFSVHVSIPSSWKTAWTHGMTSSGAALTWQGVWDRDRVMAALLTYDTASE